MGMGIARGRAASGLLAASSLLLLLAATVVCAVVLHTANVGAYQHGTPRAVLAAQAAMSVATVLTMLLAGVALTLGARLVASVRERELWLLRARGYSGSQVHALAVREAALVALPAALLAPLLGGVTVWLLTRLSPTATDGQAAIAPAGVLDGVGPALWLVSLAVAAAGVAALALVGHRSTAPGSGQGSAGRAALLRTGVDVVVGLLAALAVWQLVRYDGVVATGAGGRAVVDPLIVAAPALVLLTGALLSLRLLLWASRRLDGLAARARSIGAPLGVWQVSRRSARQVGPALLLVLALGVSALSLTYTSSWAASQAAQADLASGATLSVDAEPGRTSAATSALLTAVDGVDGALPVLSGTTRGNRLIAWDVEKAPSLVLAADALVADPDGLAAASAELLAARPDAPTVPLPDGTTAVRLTLTLPEDAGARDDDGHEEPVVDPDSDAIPTAGIHDLRVALVLRDADGLLHRLPRADLVAVDGSPGTFTADVPAARSEDGDWGEAVTGAGIVAVEVGVLGPGAPVENTWEAASGHQVGLIDVDLTLAAGALTADGPVALEAPDAWRARGPVPNPLLPVPRVHVLDGGSGDTLVRLEAQTFRLGLYQLTLRPVAADDETAGLLTTPAFAAEVPVLATFERSAPSTVAGQRITWQPVGGLAAIPGQGLEGASRDGFVADLPTLALTVFEANGAMVEPTEWWLAADSTGLEQTIAAMNASPFGPVTADRAALEHQWQAGPLGAAVSEAIRLTLVAAVVFAAVGIALATVVAVRERRAELAVLRAVGTSPGQLTASVAVEHALLLGTAILLGGALGVGLTHLLLPRLVRDARGLPPTPAVETVVPWAALAVLVAVVAAATAVAVVAVMRSLSRSDLARTLRSEVAR